MKISETRFQDLYLISNFVSSDDRGYFIKNYNEKSFGDILKKNSFKETYFSISKKGVLRGMHFQIPPHDHYKLVTVNQGGILDVVFDLRPSSSHYGTCFSIELDRKSSLLIPPGMAHGFLSLEDNTIVSYQTTTGYNQEGDCGIHYDSIGFDWPQKAISVVSERDKNFAKFEDFKNTFT